MTPTLAEIEAEAKRARRLYDLLVVPGAEVTQNHIRSKKNSHIIGLNLRKFVSADQPAEDILKAIRRQGALSIACHPHHRTTRRIEIGDLLSLGPPQEPGRARGRVGSGEPR